MQFTNCRILREGKLLREDLWVRGGRILDPQKLFFDEKRAADEQRDCGGHILAPGFIDVQINGGFGVDFSLPNEDIASGVALVAKKLLSHGVTAFCPTMVTSPSDVYHKALGVLFTDFLSFPAHLAPPAMQFFSWEKGETAKCIRSFLILL